MRAQAYYSAKDAFERERLTGVEFSQYQSTLRAMETWQVKAQFDTLDAEAKKQTVSEEAGDSAGWDMWRLAGSFLRKRLAYAIASEGAE